MSSKLLGGSNNIDTFLTRVADEYERGINGQVEVVESVVRLATVINTFSVLL